jgi:hypothetical protein
MAASKGTREPEEFKGVKFRYSLTYTLLQFRNSYTTLRAVKD